MRFEIVQSYQSGAQAVIDAYAEASLYPTLVGLPKLGRIEGTPDRLTQILSPIK